MLEAWDFYNATSQLSDMLCLIPKSCQKNMTSEHLFHNEAVTWYSFSPSRHLWPFQVFFSECSMPLNVNVILKTERTSYYRVLVDFFFSDNGVLVDEWMTLMCGHFIV
jgi:hypothetical protein